MQDQQNNSSNVPVQSPPPQGVSPLAPQPTPTQPQGDFLHPIVDPPKHAYHPKQVMIGLTVAVVVALVVVAVLVVYAIMPHRDTSTTKSDNSTVATTKVESLTAEQTLKELKSVLPEDAVSAQQAITLPVTAPKKSFYTVIPDAAPVQGLAATVADSKVSGQIAAVEKSLSSHKFTTKAIRDLTDATGFLSYYIRDDVICQTTASPVDATAKTRKVEVDCLDMARYTEYADAQQPMASVYTPATTGSVTFAFTGKPATTPSATAGYNLVDLPVSSVIDQQVTSYGTVAAFYQSPDGLWHYFLDHDSTVLVACQKYSTTPVLYAYAGKPCLNNKTTAKDVVVAPKTKK